MHGNVVVVDEDDETALFWGCSEGKACIEERTVLRLDRLAVIEAVLEREKLAEPDSVSDCERLAVFDTVPEREG